jgi:hypothetical protein
MVRDTKFRLKLVAAFALGSLALNVITISGHWDGIAGYWGFLNLIPFILSMFIAGNPHSGSEVAICVLSMIQWATVGYLIGKVIR